MAGDTTAGGEPPMRDLSVCLGCGCDLVEPVEWEEAGTVNWEVVLWCPNCGWGETGVFDQVTVDAFDEKLDAAAEMGDAVPDQGSTQPDLMAALEASLDRPTWVIHLAKHAGPGRSRSETWVGVADDREAANAAALAWVRDPTFYVSYADGPFVPLRDRDRLRDENEALKAAIDSALQTTWTQDEEGGWGTSEDRLHADRLTALAALQPFWQGWGDVTWDASGRDSERAHQLDIENEALRKRADESDRALRMFQAGLTDTLRVYNVPAMPSWPEAIHWLARNGRRQSDEQGQPKESTDGPHR